VTSPNGSAARTRQTVGGLALIAAFMASAIGLQQVRDRTYALREPLQQALYLTSERAVERMSLGFRALNADLYWIRALQYYGGIQQAHREGRRSPEPGPEYGSLFSFLDLATTLDPQFNIAYRFGAIYLSEPPPAGPGRTDLAIRLLNKGLAARPDKWEYMQDIGFVHYWYRRDYETAAAWFQKASGLPGAPWWMQSLAATTLAQGGDRNSSRRMWEAIRSSAEVDWLRRDAERRLMQLRALDEIDVLQKRVDAVTARTGEYPSDWRVLIRAGALPAIPLDPSGTVYELSEGHVRLARPSPLWPPPDEPAAMR